MATSSNETLSYNEALHPKGEVSKMSTPGIDTSFQKLGEIVDNLDQGFQGYFFPGLFQGFHIRVRLLAHFSFED